MISPQPRLLPSAQPRLANTKTTIKKEAPPPLALVAGTHTHTALSHLADGGGDSGRAGQRRELPNSLPRPLW